MFGFGEVPFSRAFERALQAALSQMPAGAIRELPPDHFYRLLLRLFNIPGLMVGSPSQLQPSAHTLQFLGDSAQNLPGNEQKRASPHQVYFIESAAIRVCHAGDRRVVFAGTGVAEAQCDLTWGLYYRLQQTKMVNRLVLCLPRGAIGSWKACLRQRAKMDVKVVRKGTDLDRLNGTENCVIVSQDMSRVDSAYVAVEIERRRVLRSLLSRTDCLLVLNEPSKLSEFLRGQINKNPLTLRVLLFGQGVSESDLRAAKGFNDEHSEQCETWANLILKCFAPVPFESPVSLEAVYLAWLNYAASIGNVLHMRGEENLPVPSKPNIRDNLQSETLLRCMVGDSLGTFWQLLNVLVNEQNQGNPNHEEGSQYLASSTQVVDGRIHELFLQLQQDIALSDELFASYLFSGKTCAQENPYLFSKIGESSSYTGFTGLLHGPFKQRFLAILPRIALLKGLVDPKIVSLAFSLNVINDFIDIVLGRVCAHSTQNSQITSECCVPLLRFFMTPAIKFSCRYNEWMDDWNKAVSTVLSVWSDTPAFVPSSQKDFIVLCSREVLELFVHFEARDSYVKLCALFIRAFPENLDKDLMDICVSQISPLFSEVEKQQNISWLDFVHVIRQQYLSKVIDVSRREWLAIKLGIVKPKQGAADDSGSLSSVSASLELAADDAPPPGSCSLALPKYPGSVGHENPATDSLPGGMFFGGEQALQGANRYRAATGGVPDPKRLCQDSSLPKDPGNTEHENPVGLNFDHFRRPFRQ